MFILLIFSSGCALFAGKGDGYLRKQRITEDEYYTSAPMPKRTILFTEEELMLYRQQMEKMGTWKKGEKIQVVVQDLPMGGDLGQKLAQKDKSLKTGELGNFEAERELSLRSIKQALIIAEEEKAKAKDEVQALRLKEETLKSELVKTENILVELKKEVPGLSYEQQYEVKEGDSLWGIAGRKDIYNDGFKWLEIYHSNRDKIESPDRIYPGQILIIPKYNKDKNE